MRKPIKWFSWFLIPIVAAIAISFSPAVQAQLIATSNSSPPLGAFVRRLDPVTRPGATAYAMWTTNTASEHQVWFRIKGGSAQLIQQLQVYQENAEPRPGDSLPPASALVQEIPTNAPTPWYILPAKRDIYTYYIDGDHGNTQVPADANGYGVSVTQSRYERGNMFEIRFEDRPILDDYNDLEVEVAFLQR